MPEKFEIMTAIILGMMRPFVGQHAGRAKK
jgi:hypothetical protein